MAIQSPDIPSTQKDKLGKPSRAVRPKGVLLVFVFARNKVYLEVRQRYNRQLPLLEKSVNGFQQHLRAAVSAACDRGCCCATSGLCCQFLACLLPRQQEG
eukprot:scaffold97_cov38-Phaeocystis_antarctica.AAC.1